MVTIIATLHVAEQPLRVIRQHPGMSAVSSGFFACRHRRHNEPLRWAAFAVWLTMLLNRHGRAILRVKGLLRVVGVPTPVVIHGIQRTIHPPIHLGAWPEGVPRTCLILIAEGVDHARVEASLAAFSRLATAE